MFQDPPDSARYFQNRFSLSDTLHIGVELSDPRDGACGIKCRYRDVAVMSADGGYQGRAGAHVARTLSTNGPGLDKVATRRIDENNPYLIIEQHVKSRDLTAYTNEPVYKMGLRTGWTWGYINHTCADPWLVSNTQSDLRCQNFANYGANEGDSGGPVFFLSPSTEYVRVVGIHVSRNTKKFTTNEQAMFSSIGGIEADHGPIDVVLFLP
jgi:hypothetical protein